MKEVLDFLRDLSEHNYKEWFDANKERYLHARACMDSLVTELIAGIRKFDGSIGPLQAKDCSYRIYRDLRFSKDKTPYKNHMGAYINRGGKKSGYSGYYFHLGSPLAGNMLAVGDIWCPPEVLKVIREDILLGGGDFRRILAGADKRLHLDSDAALKRVPAPFPKDTPDSEYFKYKYFCLCYAPGDGFFTAKGTERRLLEVFESTRPFLDYINRAFDYVSEQKRLAY